jgi:hypothetical protein
VNAITVDKTKLIEIMKENHGKHHDIVVEAQAGFRAKVIERLDEMLGQARDGKRIDIAVGLVVPEDHTDDYDRVIGMLELDIEETVELEESEYRQYVEDKWQWQRSFNASNSYYSRTAAANL